MTESKLLYLINFVSEKCVHKCSRWKFSAMWRNIKTKQNTVETSNHHTSAEISN